MKEKREEERVFVWREQVFRTIPSELRARTCARGCNEKQHASFKVKTKQRQQRRRRQKKATTRVVCT